MSNENGDGGDSFFPPLFPYNATQPFHSHSPHTSPRFKISLLLFIIIVTNVVFVRFVRIFSCPCSSIPDLGQWVGHSVPLFKFDTKSDFWQMIHFKHLKKEKQKGNMTKRQNNKKTKKQKGKKTKLQNDNDKKTKWP